MRVRTYMFSRLFYEADREPRLATSSTKRPRRNQSSPGFMSLNGSRPAAVRCSRLQEEAEDAGGHGQHASEPEDRERRERVDALHHPAEIHAEEPGQDREREEIVATRVTRSRSRAVSTSIVAQASQSARRDILEAAVRRSHRTLGAQPRCSI